MISFGACYMCCDECPLACHEIQERYERLKEYGDWQPEYCYCEKVGQEFYVGGCCGDAFEPKQHKNKGGKRRSGLAYRRKMSVKKDKALRKILGYGYKPYAGWVDWDWVDGVWQETGKYIKYPKNSNKQAYYKRYTNKIVRRQYELPVKGNQYRKHFDYWWTMY